MARRGGREGKGVRHDIGADSYMYGRCRRYKRGRGRGNPASDALVRHVAPAGAVIVNISHLFSSSSSSFSIVVVAPSPAAAGVLERRAAAAAGAGEGALARVRVPNVDAAWVADLLLVRRLPRVGIDALINCRRPSSSSTNAAPVGGAAAGVGRIVIVIVAAVCVGAAPADLRDDWGERAGVRRAPAGGGGGGEGLLQPRVVDADRRWGLVEEMEGKVGDGANVSGLLRRVKEDKLTAAEG